LEIKLVLKNYKYAVLILFLAVLVLASPAGAQEGAANLPEYIVQPGDTLWTIARELYVPYQGFLDANNLDGESTVIPGERLVIPGYPGLGGLLETSSLPYGESLTSLSRTHGISEDLIVQLNRLTSPLELYQGVNVVLHRQEEGGGSAPLSGPRIALRPGQTLLEAAVEHDLNPWGLVTANGLKTSWSLVPGDVIRGPQGEDLGPGAFPAGIAGLTTRPDRFTQGKTTVIRVSAPKDTALSGSLGGRPLQFFRAVSGEYIALQGIHARAALGIEPLSLSGTLPDGTTFSHQQMVRIYSGNYIYEEISGVPPATVNMQVSTQEENLLIEAVSPGSDPKRWAGKFASPVAEPYSECWPSLFGNRRSFNGSGYRYFHSGLDFCGAVGMDIYAAAPGKVVLTDTLTIHGNTTVVDHGWGVYTLYAHQSEFLVREGDQVEKGQLIGRVGSTGRSTGAHLHLTVWVGGVQVDPMEWLQTQYP
jgi:murein DD-endopeptidase MepM/ murein hydrolase activator NlpD